MRRARPRDLITTAAAALVLMAGPAPAQGPGATLTLVGGWSNDGDLTPGLTPSTLESGWLAGLQTDLYPGGGAVGVRVGGFYTRRSLEETGDEYDVLTANLGVTLRSFPLQALGDGQLYMAFTGGTTRHKSVGDAPSFGEGVFGDDPVYRVHVTGAVGLDVPLSYRTALRFEGGDRVIFPSVGQSPTAEGFPTIHTPVLALGLQYRFTMPPRRRPARRPPPVVERAPARDTVPEAAQEPAPPDTVPEAVEEPVEAAPAVVETAVFTVQHESLLGRTTARRWAEQARARGLPAWPLDIEIAGTPASRLRLGATATETEARRLAAAVERELGWTVTVERIGDDEAVPPNALEQTRDFLAEP